MEPVRWRQRRMLVNALGGSVLRRLPPVGDDGRERGRPLAVGHREAAIGRTEVRPVGEELVVPARLAQGQLVAAGQPDL